MDLKGILGLADQTFTQRIFTPECPTFPEASFFAGRLAMWSICFCRWLGLWIKPFKKALWALSDRKSKVEWYRTPVETRRQALMVSCVGVIGAFAVIGMGRGPASPGRL